MGSLDLENQEILQYVIENGMLNLTLVQKHIAMQKREELLKKHENKIWQGKNGKWYTYLPEEKGRKLIKKNEKGELEDTIIAFWKEKIENPKIKEVFEEWIEHKLELKDISNATYDRYKVDFNRYFKEFGEKRIKNITEIEIEDFLLKSITEFSLSAKSYSNLRTLVYGIFKRAKKKKYINYSITNVIGDIEISKKAFQTKKKEDYQEVFMENEEPLILKYLEDNIDILNLGILLMFKTGIRVGELVAIKQSDIDGNVIRIQRTETRYRDENGKYHYEVKDTPKTEAGIRDVIVPKDYGWILKQLKKINPFGEYLLERNGERVKTYFIRKRLYKVCKKVDVYPKSPHKIRKTYGTILLDNNIDKLLIIQQMGHTDIACTEQHYHRNRRSQERKSEILSEIPEFKAK